MDEKYHRDPQMNRSSFLTMFSWIGPVIGPVLLVIRGGNASAIEKFCYVTMIGPLAILAISLRYAEDKQNILKESDPMRITVQLEEKRAAYRKLLIIVLIATCVSVSAAAWSIFHG